MVNTVYRYKKAKLAGLEPLVYSSFDQALTEVRDLDGERMITSWLSADRKHFSPDGNVWRDKINHAPFVGPTAPAFGFGAQATPKPLITMTGSHYFDPGEGSQFPSNTKFTMYIVYANVTTRALNFLIGGHRSRPVGTYANQEIVLSANAGAREMDIRFGQGSGNIRIFQTTVEWGGAGPIIFGIDFDAATGMAFTRNGTEIVFESGSVDREPLLDRRWQVGRIGTSASNMWRGAIHEIIICKACLRNAGYAEHRATIEGGLIARFLS